MGSLWSIRTKLYTNNEDSLNEDSDELFEGLDDEGDELLFNDDLNNDDI